MPTSAAFAQFVTLLMACSQPPVEQVLDEALPSVVLLVNDRANGDTTWGAGMVVTEDGLVLTNHHVVDEAASLRAMVYRPDRTSYTPMDGGLDRYLFEHESDLVPASVLNVDAAIDLATVQVHTDQPLAPLGAAEAPVRRGEQVYALGHPQETVWSFTSGVVSAIHSGAIQHDAAVNAGNSGGPLVNRAGRAVGVNTSKLFGDAEGVAFALPMDLAIRVVDATSERSVLDLTSPERAAATCLQAQELGSVALVDCYDWDHQWRMFELAVRDVESWEVFPKGTVTDAIEDAGDQAFWTATLRREMQRRIRHEHGYTWPELKQPVPESALHRMGWDPKLVRESRAALHADLEKRWTETKRRWTEEIGLAWTTDDKVDVPGLLKAGTRVDEVHFLDEDRAWVHIVGRNPDGSTYGWSELYARRDGLWRQIDPVLPAEVSTLPAGWPTQWTAYDAWAAKHHAFLVDWVAWTAADEEERVAARAAAAPEPVAKPAATQGATTGEVLGGQLGDPSQAK